jgi:hypothetical protein
VTDLPFTAARAVRRYETDFGVLEELAATAPGQAIIAAWGLLEYQLNTRDHAAGRSYVPLRR